MLVDGFLLAPPGPGLPAGVGAGHDSLASVGLHPLHGLLREGRVRGFLEEQGRKDGRLHLVNRYLGQVMLGQVMIGQVMSGQVIIGQVMLGMVRLGQVMLGQVMLGQVMLGQVMIGQVMLG